MIGDPLQQCFFALGQAIGTTKTLDDDVLPWLRERYADQFAGLLARDPSAWARDRDRVLAVARYLGERARDAAGDSPTISVACARAAATAVEAGCRMQASRSRAERSQN